MQHVDEGQLHAYLDGELTEPGEDPREVERHLAECAECRALLDGVRLLRERGRALLVDPLPVEQPPFDAVIARASRAAPKPARAPRRVAPLVWAASVLVALGAGWLARDLLRQDPAQQMEMAASIADSASPAPAPEVLAAVTEESQREATVAADRAAVPPAVAAKGRSLAAVGAGAPPPATAEPPATRGPAANPSLDGVVALGYGTQRRSDVPGEVTVAMAPPPPPPPPPPVAEERAEQVVPTVAAPAPATVARASAARTAPASAFAAPVADGAGWAVVDRRSAEQRLGAPLALVPDLPVLGIELSIAGAGPSVRVRQQLPGGQVLTLLAQRVPATGMREPIQARDGPVDLAAGAVTAQANAERAAVRRIGTVVLTASAALPSDSLSALLARAR